MADDKGPIFLDSETSGGVTSTITQATGSATLYSREILQENYSTTERILFIDAADDNSSTPTVQILISLYFDSGWSDYVSIFSATAVPCEIKVTSYDTSWWVRNKGVKFKFTKSGAGAVTYSNGYWL